MATALRVHSCWERLPDNRPNRQCSNPTSNPAMIGPTHSARAIQPDAAGGGGGGQRLVSQEHAVGELACGRRLQNWGGCVSISNGRVAGLPPQCHVAQPATQMAAARPASYESRLFPLVFPSLLPPHLWVGVAVRHHHPAALPGGAQPAKLGDLRQKAEGRWEAACRCHEVSTATGLWALCMVCVHAAWLHYTSPWGTQAAACSPHQTHDRSTHLHEQPAHVGGALLQPAQQRHVAGGAGNVHGSEALQVGGTTDLRP